MTQRYRFLKLGPSSSWFGGWVCPTIFLCAIFIAGCLVTLVPGAGLEPARTLPGPRDFKLHSTLAQQHQAKSQLRSFTGLATGVCGCLLLPFFGFGRVRPQFAPGKTFDDIIKRKSTLEFRY